VDTSQGSLLSARPVTCSRELGLVLTRQLLGVDDLHYGLWTPGLEVKLANITQAQQHYSDMLLQVIGGPPQPRRVFDVGCGSGRLLVQLRQRGYDAVGLSPSVSLNGDVQRRLQQHGLGGTQVITARFEEVDTNAVGRFDVVLFSESFQYIPMARALDNAARVLAPGGRVIICDFFRTDATGDGGPGDGAFRGGHWWREFAPTAQAAGFRIVRDDDITPQIAPNLELLEDVLQQRVGPAAFTIAGYAQVRYPLLSRIIGRVFRKKLEKMRFKYLSGHRSPAAFSRYKTYRLLVLQRQSDN
jgi:SAM-dependent methyltransferase